MKKTPLFMMAQLPFNSEETVKLNTPMIEIMDDEGNVPVALRNLRELGVYHKIMDKDCVFTEIGCGSGYLLEALCRNGEGTYLGFEPILSEYEKAHEKLKPFSNRANPPSVKHGLLETSGYPEGSLDYIYSYHVFEHLENPLVMLTSAIKWLKPGGKMIITCPNVESAAAQKDLSSWRCALSSHRWLPGVSTLKNAVLRNGFKIRKIFTYGGYPAPRNLIKTMINRWYKLTNRGDVVCLMAEKPA